MNNRGTTESAFDAVIIGGDVGCLVAAALLARAGSRVILLEPGLRFGGEAETIGLANEIGGPLYSPALFPLDSEMVRTLRLASHGLQFAITWATKHSCVRPCGDIGHPAADLPQVRFAQIPMIPVQIRERLPIHPETR